MVRLGKIGFTHTLTHSPTSTFRFKSDVIHIYRLIIYYIYFFVDYFCIICTAWNPFNGSVLFFYRFFFYFAYDITSYHKQMLLCMLRMKKKIEKKTAQLSKNGRLWIDIHTPDCTDLHTFDSAKFKHRLYLFGRKARIFLIWFGIFTWFSLKYTHEMKKKSARVVPLKIQSWVLLFKKKKNRIYMIFHGFHLGQYELNSI